MDILIGSLIAATIVLILVYYFHSDDVGDPSIPYAKYGSYPIIGHLISFFGDRTKLLIECRRRYGDCFKIRVFNQYFTMILSHADWATVIRNPSLQFMGVEFAVKIFGMSPVFLSQPAEFDVDMHRLYVQHLKNREGLHPIVVEFVRRTRELMRNEKAILEKNGTASDWISIGLLKFSHNMVYTPSTLALIGDIDPPSLESDFRLLDNKFHYFITPLPNWFYSWFLSNELEARSRLNSAWIKNRDPPNVSDFHRDRLTLFSNNSQWLLEKDYAGFLTGFFWASLGNTIPAVFWALLYILRDTKALETILEEIDTHLPAVSLDDDTNTGEWTPEKLDLCVYLESAINETIRLVGAPLMTRKCLKETQIVLQDGRTITVKPDEVLSWFAGSSHFDENLFPEPDKFIFDRFLNKKPDTVSGFMPFGGGKTICPGRFFVRFEIKTCVALLLRYMEYKIDDTETIPTQLISRIGFGISPPSKDMTIMYRYKI